MAGHNDLPRRVVVRGLAYLALRGLARDRPRRLIVEAEERRHRADADRHRLLHRAAANTHEPRRVGKREGAGGGVGGIFAERMAGEEGDIARKINAGFRLQYP